MTTLIVTFDGEEPTGWRYEPDDDYTPEDGELIADGWDHRDIEKCKVDTSGEKPTLVEDPEYDGRSVEERVDDLSVDFRGMENGKPVQRANITDSKKSEFQEARDNDDIQAQIDVIWGILTDDS